MELAARPALGKCTKNVSVCYDQHIAPTHLGASQRLVEGRCMPFLANGLDEPVKAVVDVLGTPESSGQCLNH